MTDDSCKYVVLSVHRAEHDLTRLVQHPDGSFGLAGFDGFLPVYEDRETAEAEYPDADILVIAPEGAEP